MDIQPRVDTKKVEEIERRKKPAENRQLMPESSMFRRLIRVSGFVVPYLAWLVPLIDRVAPKRNANASLGSDLRALSVDLRNDLRNELRNHMAAIQAAQADMNPAIEEQQQRLEKLEEHAAELNHSLVNLSEDQLDLADQVRAMAGWVRNSAIAGLSLLALLFILKLVQAIHGTGH